MPLAALLLAVLAASPSRGDDFMPVLKAWRARADGAAVSTQVVVHEGEAESAASAEPCVLAWQPEGPSVALRRGGLCVAIAEGRLRAAHEQGASAVDIEVADRAFAVWRSSFADMPWPQPAMALLPPDRLAAEMDPDVGVMRCEAMVDEDGDRVVRLVGERGRWTLRFRGDASPRLVEAVRRLDAGPRVPAGASIEWRMRFEHAEPESGIFRPPVEGRPRVDRLQAVMPAETAPARRVEPARGGHEEQATPDQRGDSLPPKP